ncbi:GNAT family N-acetyltransferase [Streptomyces hainanensis]|uniref:GNAT family N-acetyltransferase n=1 Tax=Streptomyces hainanensis TaxID=402648 RepID=A0A4R4STV5_9ACTN|nr:GNAT family N-acetyltransferase [Streptomyces hainanensis]TDC67540.1 GNAT family N-acetyltransferase [Streptomyces hainanensis]
MDFRTVRFDHPDAVKLNDEVQAEYAERYGDEGDITPLDATMFLPPRGLYLVVYDDAGSPIGTGAWRAQDKGGENYTDGDAEIKRMFVVREARGQGLSRVILARLEDDARAAGRVRMVLETGTEQPEAIALYRSSGYEPVPDAEKFGLYRTSDNSRCFTKAL